MLRFREARHRWHFGDSPRTTKLPLWLDERLDDGCFVLYGMGVGLAFHRRLLPKPVHDPLAGIPLAWLAVAVAVLLIGPPIYNAIRYGGRVVVRRRYRLAATLGLHVPLLLGTIVGTGLLAAETGWAILLGTLLGAPLLRKILLGQKIEGIELADSKRNP